MSWSVSITDKPAGAKERLAQEATTPQSIKDYIAAGIDALAKRVGDDVNIMVSGHGHLHDGSEGNYEVTSASIEVKPFVGG